MPVHPVVIKLLSQNRLPGLNWRLDLLRKFASTGPGGLALCRVGFITLQLDPYDEYQLQMMCGTYERPLMSFLAKTLRKGDTYVDVGAHVGYTAAIAARSVGPAGRIILFEPDKRLHARLRSSFMERTDSRAPTAHVFMEACSSTATALPFHLARSSQALVWRNTFDFDQRAVESVPAVTLDETLAKLQVTRIRVLKIDAEGHEIEVLQGAQRTLASQLADYIMIEKNSGLLAWNRFHPEHLHALISLHGYCGVHETGEAISQQSMDLNVRPLENLSYARDAALLREVFSESLQSGQPYTRHHLAQLVADTCQEHSPSRSVNEAILLAQAGKMAEAIILAEQIQGKPPAPTRLMGHLAYWYIEQGRLEEACRQLELFLQWRPHDEAALYLLEQCREKLSGKNKNAADEHGS